MEALPLDFVTMIGGLNYITCHKELIRDFMFWFSVFSVVRLWTKSADILKALLLKYSPN